MRHKNKGRKFNRTWEHRKAMFNNMARSLITYGRIQTTVSKAKELRGLVEGLVTLALRNDLHARRQAFKILNSHQLVKKLFDEIGPRFAESPKGGYTRVVKLAVPRPGDSASLAIIEFTRLPGEETQAKKPAKSKQTQAEPTTEPAAEPTAKSEAKPKTSAKAKKPAKAPAAKKKVTEEQAEAPAEAAVETPVKEEGVETAAQAPEEAPNEGTTSDEPAVEPQTEEDDSKTE